jgi:hypothetical protein
MGGWMCLQAKETMQHYVDSIGEAVESIRAECAFALQSLLADIDNIVGRWVVSMHAQ